MATQSVDLRPAVRLVAFLVDEQAVRAVRHPVLLCESPPTVGGEEGLDTSIGGQFEPAHPGEPLVFELQKRRSLENAFGVTVGRSENNDVVLVTASISRFHAYFECATPEVWKLAD